MQDCGFNFDHTFCRLPAVFYTKQMPVGAPSPKLMVLNTMLASALDLDFSHLASTDQADLFSGNIFPPGVTPYAQAYAGHQFGHFSILGDGRACLWGEHVNKSGLRFDIQFKGSGPTAYSRGGDGKAALGPMLREYIISEAMHALGIPTTRSLAVVTTGESIMRQTKLPGAMLTRVARSHIRIGTFEFAAIQKDDALLQALLDYTIMRHFPDCQQAANPALALLQVMISHYVHLMVQWARVGFIHGVMNTDNMTLSGETIDYGPCAFMDAYNPHRVLSAIDQSGRYAFSQQPKIAQWNLACFAETILPLVDRDKRRAVKNIKALLNPFAQQYQTAWLQMMSNKLGICHSQPSDLNLIMDLLSWMQKNQADFTNTFFDLAQANLPDIPLYQQSAFQSWYKRWQHRIIADDCTIEQARLHMHRVNPTVIARNHQVEFVLQAAENGDMQPFHALQLALQKPYEYDVSKRIYQRPPTPDEQVYQTFCGT